MFDALPLRIFLASPGGLEAERDAVRACVDKHNSRYGDKTSVSYEVLGWERVRGTARRPQEAINELIVESHFLVTLFGASWGSEPGSPWGYTSGTEEELFTALLALGQAEQPMRDVWVAFLDHPTPDDQIVNLRGQISERHALMYETIAGIGELCEKFAERLRAWEPLADLKVQRHIDLLPSSRKDVLGAQRLRIRGEKLIELGHAEAGEEALREASHVGGPVEQLAHARFLARSGDLSGAFDETQRAIEHFTDSASNLYSPLAAEAFAAQAGVLRRQRRDFDAIGRLKQALTLLDESDAYSQKVRCRILDDLGLAHQATEDLEAARDAFEAALDSRRQARYDVAVCQSLVNLARLEVGAGNLATAARHADEASTSLRSAPPTALHANAEVLVAQVRLRQGRPDDGLEHARRALSLNRQLANRRGEAIAQLLLAQCFRATGREREAARHARACLELNESMENAAGVQKAKWILDQMVE